METQVGIVGAGPAGLLLSHMLQRRGVASVVVEARSRTYVENRVRAGVLEQGSVDTLCEEGVGARLRREGLVHEGIELRFLGERHRIALRELTDGRCITIYGQREVVKDLIDARLAAGGAVHFEVDDVSIHDVDTERPSLRYTADGRDVELRCDFIAGCDGFHGISRRAVPPGYLRVYEREYPFGWVGILADVEPSTDEVVYAYHPRGLAMHSVRSKTVSRLYLQCPPDDVIDSWSDDRIWHELHVRLATRDGWVLKEGPIREKGITSMRSFAVEPMQYGRLFLAGDAAHIVPPTGAKGLNLAVADVRILADALAEWYRAGRTDRLETYSERCLARVWRTQHFSAWMTSMLHAPLEDVSGFESRLQLAQLAYIASSQPAARSLADNYVGLPFVQ